MVEYWTFENGTIQNQNLKCSDFGWNLVFRVRISSRHCIIIFVCSRIWWNDNVQQKSRNLNDAPSTGSNIGNHLPRPSTPRKARPVFGTVFGRQLNNKTAFGQWCRPTTEIRNRYLCFPLYFNSLAACYDQEQAYFSWCLQWESKVRTSPDFEWFAKPHYLKSEQKCPDFQWSGPLL